MTQSNLVVFGGRRLAVRALDVAIHVLESAEARRRTIAILRLWRKRLSQGGQPC